MKNENQAALDALVSSHDAEVALRKKTQKAAVAVAKADHQAVLDEIKKDSAGANTR